MRLLHPRYDGLGVLCLSHPARQARVEVMPRLRCRGEGAGRAHRGAARQQAGGGEQGDAAADVGVGRMNDFVLLIAIGCVLWSAYVLYWAFWPGDDECLDRDDHDLTPAIRYRRRRP